MAVKNMRESGVPASITLAQGILESSSGNSELAVKGNNHFGIKCHDWKGKKIYADDDKKNECFRKYNSAYESYRDHAEFLRTRSRYAFLFELPITDYKSWAKGLKKAGYATDPKYPDKLISLIERYELYIYDSDDIIVDSKTNDKGKNKLINNNKNTFTIDPYQYKESTNNSVPYVYAKEGDNISKLANDLDMMDWQIRRYNDFDKGYIIQTGEVIYIKPKKRKAAKEHKTHLVKQGESMHDISQLYGVKLRRLYRMNKIERGTDVPSGTKLNLRKTKR
jgi:LysM repeat protein